MYLLVLFYVSLLLSTLIGWFSIVLCLCLFSIIIITLYMFRFTSNLPVELATNTSILVWPSEGTLINIEENTHLITLKGMLFTIECGLFDMYTHVAPIQGMITKIITINNHADYGHGTYIEITNNICQTGLIICSKNTTNRVVLYVKQDTQVYVGQPLCLSVFNTQIYFVIQGLNINTKTMYIDQKTILSNVISYTERASIVSN